MIRPPHLPALPTLALLMCAEHAETIAGKARVIDSATIEVAGIGVRLEA